MFFSKVVAVAALFYAQSAYATPSCARSYTVQPGDWCDTISANKNVSTYQLAVTNIDKIDKTCSNLIPGDSLCLGFTGQDCTTTYIIQANDRCDVIAANHGLNTTMLFLNNPQINADCDNIYVGEVLCVAGGVAVPTLPAGKPVPAATPPPGAVPANPSPSAAPATPAAPKPTPPPQPTPVDDGDDEDDEDCEDDEDDEPATPAAKTPAPNPTPSGAPSDDHLDDGDDDDLPFCDEL